MIYWPTLLSPLSISIDAASRTVQGTPAILGLTQHAVSSAGVWAITYEGVAIKGAARIKSWRALQVQAEGRANPIVVPIRDRSELRPAGARGEATFGDGGTFGDGSVFTSDVDAKVGAAARGAVDLAITGPVAAIDAGQHFSLGDRLYRIKYVGDVAGSTVAVKVWPPLREAVADGTVANFGRPQCKVRLATDGEMDHSLVALQSAAPTVRFIEDVS